MITVVNLRSPIVCFIFTELARCPSDLSCFRIKKIKMNSAKLCIKTLLLFEMINEEMPGICWRYEDDDDDDDIQKVILFYNIW